MFGLFRREVALHDYLRRTKKVRVNGIGFEIRKVDLKDHAEGLNIILNLHQLYVRKKDRDGLKSAVVQDEKKLKDFMRHFLYAGVVAPRLTLKNPPEDGATSVDELMQDVDLAQKLCTQVLQYSYGKKN
jgi:hypothetical protein